MKSLILILLALFLCVQAQCPVNNTKTYPQTGETVCNDEETNGPCKFDWLQENWEVAYKNALTQTVREEIKNPYYATSNSNTYAFAIYENQIMKDMAQEEGWELIKKDFGLPFTSPANSLPYVSIMFYNKYRSILRVFIYITQKATSYNGASIDLRFKNQAANQIQTAVLNHYEPVCGALDGFTKKINQSVPNYLPDAVPYWLHADFIMAYDPCTCFADAKARLAGSNLAFEIRPKYIQTSNLKFTLNGTSTEQISNTAAVDPNAASQASNGFFDNLTPAKIGAAVQNGIKIYKEAGSAISTFENLVRQRKGDVNWKTFETIAAYEKWLEDTKGLVEPIDVKYSTTDGTVRANIGSVAVKNLFQFPNFLKQTIPYAGAAFGLIEFFVNGGSSSPQAQPKPAVHYLDLKGSGTITYETEGSPIHVGLPGTDVSTLAASSRPAYNNVLGIFNLLETPKLEKVYYAPTPDILKEYNQYEGKYVLCAQGGGYAISQFTLTNDISYAVNPASGLELVDLQCALLFDAPVDLRRNFVYFGMPSSDVYSTADKAVARTFAKCFVEAHSGLEGGFTQYRSEFMSPDLLKKLNFSIINGSNVKVKYMVKAILQRKDRPDLPNVTFVSTYRTNIVDAGGDWAAGKKNATSTMYYSPTDQRLTFGYTLNTDKFYCRDAAPRDNNGVIYGDYCGCKQAGSKAFVVAGYKNNKYGINRNDLKNQLIIEGYPVETSLKSIGSILIQDADVINTQSAPLKITALYDITVTGESSSSGEIVVENTVLPSVFPENINWSNHCQNLSFYNPVVPAGSRQDSEVEDMDATLSTCSAFPNPTKGLVTFEVMQQNEGITSLYITDLMGHKIQSLCKDQMLSKGSYKFDYQTESLANGVYLYTVETDGIKHTQRFVVVK